MDALLLIGIVIVVVGIGAWIVTAALRSMRPTVPEAQTSTSARTAAPSAPSAQRPLSAEAAAEIDRLVVSGQKIAAIKVYRDHTGVRLQEAKDRIEHWSAGPAGAHATPAYATPATTAVPTTPATVRASLPASVAADIDALVAGDQKIVAIKVLREHTGLGLKDSKTLIDGWIPGPAPR